MTTANLPILINTRPTHRGDAIRAMADAVVLDCPLLSIADCPLGTQENAWLDDWQNGQYALLIVTSVESARRAIKHLAERGFDDYPATPIVAVGTATAQVFDELGLSVILPATANNEGMLALPIVKNLTAGDRVLIWRGVSGRRLLHDDLVARGVQIDAIEWYERSKPADLSAQFTKIQAQLDHAKTPPFVIISSQMAFENWLSLPHRHDYHYLPLGERLAHIISQALPNVNLTTIDNLSTTHLSTIITKIGQQHANLR